MLFLQVIHLLLCHSIFPYIPSSQFGVVKGTGVQDCGTALAFTAIQALEDRKEC